MPERIQLKSPDQIAAMREAGLVVSRALDAMRRAVAPGLSTAELDAIARGVLRQACETAMWDGLAAARAGARLSDISHQIQTSIRRAGRYGIVAGYGGHGIGSDMHMAPHILNYGRPGKGPRLVPGMALAIEPMVTLGSRATQELDDGWTVVTVDGSWAAHWEHTVAILDDGPWVLTAEDGGRAELAQRGVRLS